MQLDVHAMSSKDAGSLGWSFGLTLLGLPLENSAKPEIGNAFKYTGSNPSKGFTSSSSGICFFWWWYELEAQPKV